MSNKHSLAGQSQPRPVTDEATGVDKRLQFAPEPMPHVDAISCVYGS